MTRYMLAKLEERQQQDYVGSKDHVSVRHMS